MWANSAKIHLDSRWNAVTAVNDIMALQNTENMPLASSKDIQALFLKPKWTYVYPGSSNNHNTENYSSNDATLTLAGILFNERKDHSVKNGNRQNYYPPVCTLMVTYPQPSDWSSEVACLDPAVSISSFEQVVKMTLFNGSSFSEELTTPIPKECRVEDWHHLCKVATVGLNSYLRLAVVEVPTAAAAAAVWKKEKAAAVNSRNNSKTKKVARPIAKLPDKCNAAQC
eukprot:GHVT01005357.1.p1 GENE.GHVT01005357.1~~GHVT01005357.1.p1  ORF type:complete len:227 (+),score=28.71 GHVT01005357.1:210-890(+)